MARTWAVASRSHEVLNKALQPTKPAGLWPSAFAAELTKQFQRSCHNALPWLTGATFAKWLDAIIFFSLAIKSIGEITMSISLVGLTLHVADVERSLNFYKRLPDSSILFHMPGKFALLRVGGGRLGLLQD